MRGGRRAVGHSSLMEDVKEQAAQIRAQAASLRRTADVLLRVADGLDPESADPSRYAAPLDERRSVDRLRDDAVFVWEAYAAFSAYQARRASSLPAAAKATESARVDELRDRRDDALVRYAAAAGISVDEAENMVVESVRRRLDDELAVRTEGADFSCYTPDANRAVRDGIAAVVDDIRAARIVSADDATRRMFKVLTEVEAAHPSAGVGDDAVRSQAWRVLCDAAEERGLAWGA